MSVGPRPGARAFGGPGEGGGDRVGIGAVDGDARHAVAGGLVGEHAHRRLIARPASTARSGCSATQKIAGSRRAAQRLIASCHSPSDDPPSPMNETATRREPSRENAIAMPASVSARWSAARPAAGCPSRDRRWARSLPSVGGPALRHLRVQHHAHGRRLGPHRERRAEIANHRRDDVALPAAAVAAVASRRGAGASRRRRSLPGRANGSPCPETRRAEADLAADEERLEAVVGGARQRACRAGSRGVRPAVSEARSRRGAGSRRRRRAARSTAEHHRDAADTPGVGSGRSGGC